MLIYVKAYSVIYLHENLSCLCLHPSAKIYIYICIYIYIFICMYMTESSLHKMNEWICCLNKIKQIYKTITMFRVIFQNVFLQK